MISSLSSWSFVGEVIEINLKGRPTLRFGKWVQTSSRGKKERSLRLVQTSEKYKLSVVPRTSLSTSITEESAKMINSRPLKSVTRLAGTFVVSPWSPIKRAQDTTALLSALNAGKIEFTCLKASHSRIVSFRYGWVSKLALFEAKTRALIKPPKQTGLG